jgi:hypothetical protein
MESYLEVVSFLINVSMHNQQKSPSVICICVSVSGRIWFWDIHIRKRRIWEFWIWIFIVYIQGLGYDKYGISLVAKSGGKFCAIIVKLFTWKFLQVPTSSCINLFRWILYFHCSYLGFKGRKIWCLAHCKEWGEALHHHCWAFHLRVSTSFCINSFKWILYCTSSFQLSTSLALLKSSNKFLQVPTSTCSPMAFSNSVVW